MKTESNDFSSCNKFENKNINMNNNYFSIKNKPKDKKHPPKRPNKLLKCPFKLNLLDIINENTKNGNTLPNNSILTLIMRCIDMLIPWVSQNS
jgi:hypothetical protein